MTIDSHSRRTGVTLIELIVAVVILGVLLSVTTLSLAGEKRKVAATESIQARVSALRHAAIHTGVVQTDTLRDSSGLALVTALPDGRVLSDPANIGQLKKSAVTSPVQYVR